MVISLKIENQYITSGFGYCHLRYEPRHEKTGFLPMRKQRRRSAVQ